MYQTRTYFVVSVRAGFSVCLCISGACSALLSVQPCTVVTELAGSVNLGDVITALALLFSLVTVSVSQ